MGRLDDVEFVRECNKICGTILRYERRKRRISLKDLASGMLSHTALGDMEEGKAGWTKLTGDILMQRMGVPAEYFEVVASAEELDRWRLREDICLLVPEQPEVAAGEIRKYRQKYKKREAAEEQFLQKVEVLLSLLAWKKAKEAGGCPPEGEQVLEKARQAVACTVLDGWEGNMDELWLAPAELEAILLVAASWAVCGENDRAWALQQSVWNYPKGRQWKEHVMMLILPQAALLGMGLAPGGNRGRAAFGMGQEALELLRRCSSHCYVLPLLECLCRSRYLAEGRHLEGNQSFADRDGQYLEQVEGFRDTFRQIYGWFGYPEYRLWQGISVDNTRDAGMVLKMLRKFHGKSYEDAVYDGTEQIVTRRQLQKIEKGIHKPSYANYQRLAGQYGKYGGWKTAMLETDSLEALELRQRIASLVGRNEWREAEWETERLRNMVNAEYPRAKQELLFLDALFLWERDNAMEDSLAVSLEALHCTVPDTEGKNVKYWVFQREEIMIASHIASLYRRMDRMEESKEWFEDVIFSLEQQRVRTGIPHKGYDILMGSYDNLLGDIQCFEEAASKNEEAIQNYLKWPQIRFMASMFYRLVWNSYEMAAREERQSEKLHSKWKTAFQISESLADFLNDVNLKKFLEPRRNKFLV